jgi:ribosomal-protein-alanine N-acetyltransferase
MTDTRLVTLDGVPVLAALLRANRDFLAPWEPVRGDEYFTGGGQRENVARALARCEQGVQVPHVIVDESGRVAGCTT